MSDNKKESNPGFLKRLFKREKKKCVSVIYLHGVIGSASRYSGQPSLNLKSLKKIIDKSFENKNNVAIALSINSPGGSPVQSEIISNYIKKKAEKEKLPVFSFVEDLAASGGYWLACTGEKIYASENSIIGSIGVISAGFGFVDAIKKLGIERRIITQGENKSVLDPFQPIKAGDIKIIEGIQKEIHQSFKNHVKNNRKNLKSDDSLFSGEFWSGSKAKELGLVDELNDMYSVLQEKFGEDIKICTFTEPKSFIKKLLGVEFSEDFGSRLISRIKEEISWERYEL